MVMNELSSRSICSFYQCHCRPRSGHAPSAKLVDNYYNTARLLVVKNYLYVVRWSKIKLTNINALGGTTLHSNHLQPCLWVKTCLPYTSLHQQGWLDVHHPNSGVIALDPSPSRIPSCQHLSTNLIGGWARHPSEKKWVLQMGIWFPTYHGKMVQHIPKPPNNNIVDWHIPLIFQNIFHLL